MSQERIFAIKLSELEHQYEHMQRNPVSKTKQNKTKNKQIKIQSRNRNNEPYSIVIVKHSHMSQTIYNEFP